MDNVKIGFVGVGGMGQCAHLLEPWANFADDLVGKPEPDSP